jgi:uncharacterized protein (TIGR02594 family)
MAAPLPTAYKWLYKEPGPLMLLKALELFGTVEWAKGSNPVIMGWAEEVGLKGAYSDDDIPWCGLFIAVVAKRATWTPVASLLWARNWSKFGNPAPNGVPMLCDVMVFSRGTGGHVGLYVGEDNTTWHVLGGNQSNRVSIMRITKRKSGDGVLLAVRRAPWRIAQPANVRRITLGATGIPVGGSQA